MTECDHSGGAKKSKFHSSSIQRKATNCFLAFLAAVLLAIYSPVSEIEGWPVLCAFGIILSFAAFFRWRKAARLAKLPPRSRSVG
jgi:hypothetical protein